MITVLIVDGEQSLVRAFARILTGAGYDVITANDVDGARTCLQAAPQTALILCDIGLPGVDGLSLLRSLRETHPHVPVVMVTGSPTVDTAIAAVECGAFRYLKKPIDADALLDVVKKGVQLHRLAILQQQAMQVVKTPEQARHSEIRRRFEEAILSIWMAYQPIRSMVELCREMGITTIAEGVETTAERDVLVAMGCDLLQGYLFAKPQAPFCTVDF